MKHQQPTHVQVAGHGLFEPRSVTGTQVSLYLQA